MLNPTYVPTCPFLGLGIQAYLSVYKFCTLQRLGGKFQDCGKEHRPGPPVCLQTRQNTVHRSSVVDNIEIEDTVGQVAGARLHVSTRIQQNQSLRCFCVFLHKGFQSIMIYC